MGRKFAFRLHLLATFFLLWGSFYTCSSDGWGRISKENVVQQIKEYRQDILEASGHHHGRGHRVKRATITADSPLFLLRQKRKISTPRSEEGGYLVRSVFRLEPQFLDNILTLDINAFSVKNQTFVITLENSLESNRSTQLVLYHLNKEGLKFTPSEVARKDVAGATRVEVTEIEKIWYVLPLVDEPLPPTPAPLLPPPDADGGDSSNNDVSDSLSYRGSPLLRIDMVQRKFVQVQTIPTPHAHAAAFWQASSGDVANSVWMAVAPTHRKDEEGRIEVKVEVGVYRWQGGYLDSVSTLPASNPQTVTHFTILNSPYLAVANFMDDAGSTNVYSEVFKYEYKESKFSSFQRIRTFGAKDIKHFSFHQDGRMEHFLAIANHCVRDDQGREDFHVKSIIMKFAERRFVPFKSFHTNGALQFLPINVDSKFYLVLLEKERLRIFQYNGWNFVQVARYPILPKIDDGILNKMLLRPFIHQQQPNFAISSITPTFPGGIFSVTVEQRNDYSELASGLEKWCNSARRRLLEVDVSALKDSVEKAPKITDDEIHLKNSLTFTNSLLVDTLITQEVKAGGILFNEAFAKQLKRLHDEKIPDKVSLLQGLADRAVYRNQEHDIRSKVIFAEINYKGQELEADKAKIIDWNKNNVPEFVENLILTNHDINLTTLQSTTPVHFNKGLNVGTLNNVQFSDYAVKSSGEAAPNAFMRKNKFVEEGAIGGASTVKGLFAKVDLNNPNFILANGNQTFDNVVRIVDAQVERLYTSLLNGENIGDYFRDSVPLHGDAEIEAPHQWKQITADTVVAKGEINRVNLDRLFASGIHIDNSKLPPHTFSGAKMRHVAVTGLSKVNVENPLINGRYNLSRDFLNSHNGNYSFTELVLPNGGNVNTLTVRSKMNKLDATATKDFGLFLKTSSSVQRINNKRVKGVHFEAHVTAETFAGVNLTKWSPTQKITLRNSRFNRKVNIHGTLNAPSVTVKHSLSQSGHQLLPYFSNKTTVSVENPRLPQKCQLVFHNLDVQGDTKVEGKINGRSPSNWMKKNDAEEGQSERAIRIVKGKKIFTGNLKLHENAKTNALFPNYPSARKDDILPIISDLLRQDVDQTITAPTTFTGMLKATQLNCRKVTLGNTPLESLMFRKGTQEITTPTHFANTVAVGNFHVRENLAFSGLINTFNFSAAVDDTLRTSPHPPNTKQILKGTFHFEDLLEVSNLITKGQSASHDWESLFSSFIRNDRQEPLILKKFTKLTIHGGFRTPTLLYNGMLNTISSSEWGKLWLLSDGNQTVYTPTEFMEELSITRVWSKQKTFKGIDIVSLSAKALRIDENGKLKNVTVMEHHDTTITSLNFTSPHATLNGLKIPKNLLLKTGKPPPKGEHQRHPHRPQVVTGKKVFTNDVHVEQNLEANVLNEADMKAVLQFLLSTDPDYFKRHKVKIEGNLVLSWEPHARHSINGEEWKQLLGKIWFINQDVTIQHKPTFSTLSLKAGARFKNPDLTLNGLRLKHFEQHYVSKTKDQEWKGHVVFAGQVEMDELQTVDVTCNNFNGHNVSSLLHSRLTNGTNQTIHNMEIFSLLADHILLHPSHRHTIVNDVDLDTQMATIHGPNVFVVPVTVNNLITNDFFMRPGKTTVNEINLEQWEKDALTNSDKHHIEIPKHLHLESLPLAKKLKVNGEFDGVNITEKHILLKTGHQDIRVPVHIEGNVNAPLGVRLHGPLNGIDLNATFANLVRKSDLEPIVIEGDTVFTSAIRAHAMNTEGIFQGKNLSELLSDFHEVIPRGLHFRAKENYEALTAFAENALTLAERRAVWLEYFTLYQTIERNESTYARLLFLNSPTLVLGYGVGRGSRSVETESWWVYSSPPDVYKPQQSDERLRVVGGKVVDLIELSGDDGGDGDSYKRNYPIIAVAISATSSRSISLSLPKASDHTDVFKGGVGKLSQVIILEEREVGKWVISHTVHGKEFGPLESIQMRDVTCLFVTSLDGSKSFGHIFCPTTKSYSSFHRFQSIPLDRPSLTTALELERGNQPYETLLMIATQGVEDGEGKIEIWVQYESAGHFEKKGFIPVFNAVSTDAILAPNHHPLLVVGASSSASKNFKGAVFIYRYINHGEFEKMQTLDVSSPKVVKLHVVEPSKEVFLFVLTNTALDNIVVFKFHGVAGWNREHKWTVEGAEWLELGQVTEDNVHVIVSSLNRTSIYTAIFKGMAQRQQHNRYEVIDVES